ncbi:MAG: hypothetical protein L0Y71_16075 [Gemmataceae bacterium]|nr:hypothetical protein [Gemmataceae bacterium]
MRLPRLTPVSLAFALTFPAALDAQEPKPVSQQHDAKALVDSLKEVINTGAELFNRNGDYAGCYRVYQGALLAVKPFLMVDLQNKIDQAIAKAERMPRFDDRAFALRKVIDEIREHGRGAASKAGGTKKGDMKASAAIDPTAGRVQGKINYAGRPAPPGFITLVGKDERRFSASIAADGTYTFKTPIPEGTYRVAIERVPRAKIPAHLDIPERFRAEATSGLTVEVKRGMVILNFELTR